MRREGPDERLGEALRALEVPEHGPGFEERLEARLAGERRRPRLPRLASARWPRFGLAAAAAAAAAGLAIAFVPWGGENGIGPAPATAAEVKERVAGAMASVRTMAGQLVLRAPEDGVGPLRARRWSFLLTARGDVRLTAADGSEDVALDARAGVERGLRRSASLNGGPPFAAERRGVAPGPPDYRPPDYILQRDLGAVVRALLAAADPRVEETTFGGRPAWRLDLPVEPNRIVADADRLTVTVDRETGIPVRAVTRLRGRLRSDMRIVRLTVNAPAPRDAFTVRFPAGMEVFRQQDGFRRVPLARVAALAGYRPLVPARVPEGYRLAQVAFAREAGPTGSEAANPPSRRVVSLTYRRGLDSFTVTTRMRHVADADPLAVWSDPMAAGEGIVEPEEVVRPAAGALAGRAVRLVIGPRSVPHLWALTPRLVVTVGGDLTREELLAVAGSLAPH